MIDLSIVYHKITRKASIKTNLCKHCTNFASKTLTNGPKHDIIKVQKETIVRFTTNVED